MQWLSDKAVEGLRASAAVPDLTGTRYRLIEPIGHGGMGAVYLVEDTALERRVALKVLDLPDPSGELAARILREARILAQLEHPGIVPVHDMGTLADGRVFYVMKYVQGRRLDQYAQSAPLPDRLRIFQRICEAVAFAHSAGLLHRDLKPQNVMVGPFGEVLVMDWGVAKILRDAAGSAETVVSTAPPPASQSAADTRHGAVLGSPGYMAPEQARGEVEKLTERADIYSLGAVLRFLLTGRAADEATTFAHQTDMIPRLADSSGVRVPKPLAAICAMAMADDPARRYASAQELAADVACYLDGQPVGAYPETLTEKAQRFYLRYRFWIFLILSYLILRGLILVFLGR